MSDMGQVGTQQQGSSEKPRVRYDAALAGEVEARWQGVWEREGAFRALNPGDEGFDGSRPKFYCLDMFPYPSGAGLHVGHPEGYTATDIVCRLRRMQGYNVLHPMGWDAFGLPAEQYAIQTGVHPAITTRRAIDTFRGQLKRFGFSYDWSREFATIDEGYYRWTQWIFLRVYGSWYDAAEHRARPIAELEQGLADGVYGVAGVSGEDAAPVLLNQAEGTAPELTGHGAGVRRWYELSAQEQRAFIDGQRLAYVAEGNVNWCPKLGTALANEEVIDGRSERGGFPVIRKPLRQWMLRITAYADRLLRDLALVDWPASTRAMQGEWIGKSEGAEVEFEVEGLGTQLTVFTTRPDTIFGATYMVVAPEHPLVESVLVKAGPQTDVSGLRAYVEATRKRTEVERQGEHQKSGVFTGVYALNPATGKQIPVWTADYVLMGYGTGAIMAVPGQDQRDWDFAKVYGLPIVRTVQSPAEFTGEAYTGDGPAISSGFLDGLHIADAKKRIIAWLEERGIGTRRVNYKLRDWLFSRQRYWGEPFPIVYDRNGRHYPVEESALPVTLPELADYAPQESDDPKPLLAKAKGWVDTTAGEAGVNPDVLPPGTHVTRETNTMPGWAGSCWYYLRYCDSNNADQFVGREAEAYWMGGPPLRRGSETSPPNGGPSSAGVDLYIGGAEHAVLHLLYARFWHKVLYDLGYVSTPEPFKKLFHQGLITSFAYQREDKGLVPTDQVEERGEGVYIETATGKPVKQIVAKMSKSLKNVVNPDDVIREFGADTFRLYEMYMGPLEATKPWNPRDITGLYRFLQRAWRVAVDENTGDLRAAPAPDEALERGLHRVIAKVAADIDRLSFNTAIAALIEFINAVTSADKGPGALTKDQIARFALVLSPFAPHLGEELWMRTGGAGLASLQAWPVHDEARLRDSQVEVPVSIMGKVRSRVTVPASADAKATEAAALADPKVKELIEGKAIKKVIVVPGRMVNVVLG